MVMRNRRDGGGPADGWHDLPPRVRVRLGGVGPGRAAGELIVGPPAAAAPRPAGPRLAADLARLAVAGMAVWAAMVLFLLIALAFLSGGPLPVPGR